MKVWVESKGIIHRISYKEDNEVIIKISPGENIVTTGIPNGESITVSSREELMEELMGILK